MPPNRQLLRFPAIFPESSHWYRLLQTQFCKLLFALAITLPGNVEKVAAQTACESESEAGPYVQAEVCSLQDEELTYESIESWQFIPFNIGSCGGSLFGNSCNQAVGYKVRLGSDTTDGNQFVLTGDSGSIRVNLAFTNAGGMSETLQPDILTNTFSGTVGSSPVSLSLQRGASDPTLLPGTYRGDFEFTLEQDQHCQTFIFFPVCKQTSPISIRFQIEVTVAPMIRLGGLEDRVIQGNSLGVTEDQQTFCVFSRGGAPFRITADSGTADDTFMLASNLDQIEYTTWIESLVTGMQEQLEEAQPSGQSWPGRLYENCTVGGDNMRITIRIRPEEIANAQDINYTDTLTLTVTLD